MHVAPRRRPQIQKAIIDKDMGIFDQRQILDFFFGFFGFWIFFSKCLSFNLAGV